jgi:hypothetical protein
LESSRPANTLKAQPPQEDSLADIEELKGKRQAIDVVRVESYPQILNKQSSLMHIEGFLRTSKARRTIFCIKKRNEDATRRIQKDWNLRRKIRENQPNWRYPAASNLKSGDPLKVFCTSASIFYKIAHSRKKDLQYKSFSCIQETGIPAFREFITDSILPSRENKANILLNKISALEASMCLWANDPDLEIKVSREIREVIEISVDPHLIELQEVSTITRNVRSGPVWNTVLTKGRNSLH